LHPQVDLIAWNKLKSSLPNNKVLTHSNSSSTTTTTTKASEVEARPLIDPEAWSMASRVLALVERDHSL
jgi:hypothetical protein